MKKYQFFTIAVFTLVILFVFTGCNGGIHENSFKVLHNNVEMHGIKDNDVDSLEKFKAIRLETKDFVFSTTGDILHLNKRSHDGDVRDQGYSYDIQKGEWLTIDYILIGNRANNDTLITYYTKLTDSIVASTDFQILGKSYKTNASILNNEVSTLFEKLVSQKLLTKDEYARYSVSIKKHSWNSEIMTDAKERLEILLEDRPKDQVFLMSDERMN